GGEPGRRGKIEQLLHLGHEVDLAATLQRVDALGGRRYRITVEVGGALLELREVLDRLERALRAEEALDVHAAQARRVDPAAMRLRPGVTHRVGGRRRSPGDVTVEAGDALHAGRLVGLAVGGGVELLLGELRHYEP